jgi:hypothetical protein
MNRDDRLFAIIGGTVVTAAASIFLALAGGITGEVEPGPTVRVKPISAAEPRDASDTEPSLVPTEQPAHPADVVPAGNDLTGSRIGDEAVRSLVAGISAHPQWASWLVTDDLLFRLVGAVEAVADGYSPADELGFLAAEGPFLVREDAGRLVIAAGTYRRYNLAVEVLSSVDADDAVAILRTLAPEIEEARSEVAWHRGEFEDRLRQAVDHLLEVEVPTGPIEVERRSISYAYADDGYEMLSPAQRQLLRMGRANANAVQSKLRDLRSAFGWPEADHGQELLHAVVTGSEDTLAAEPVIAELDPEVRSVEDVSPVPDALASVDLMVTPYDPRVSPIAAPPPVSVEDIEPRTAPTLP